MEDSENTGVFSPMATSWPGLGYDNGLSNTPLTTEKSAVFAPMPRARVRTAVATKPGDFRNRRVEYWRSWRRSRSQLGMWNRRASGREVSGGETGKSWTNFA